VAVIITEYNDCISIKYCNISEEEIDKKTAGALIDLDLLNGRKTEIDVAVKTKKNGEKKVVELLLDKDLSEEETDDIADLYWYVFPKKERGKKLPPVVDSWENDGFVLAACLSQKYGLKEKPFAEQWAPFESDSVPPDPERLLCWWPDPRAWDLMKQTKNLGRYYPLTGYAFPFYVFSEWFKRPDTQNVGFAERGAEYARYLRRLRTMLLFCKQKGLDAKLTVGNVKSAYHYFRKNGLNANNPDSWAAAANSFSEMPEVFVERRLPCGPAGVLDPKKETVATISYYSHMPGMPVIDCVGASLYSGNTPLCDVLAWPNPLAGEEGFKKAAEALFGVFQEYAVGKVYTVDGVLPFEACPECGNISVRFVKDPFPVRSGPKVGRNDPCPCGSGKKYKKCCGKDL
jgi:hypothetical protein